MAAIEATKIQNDNNGIKILVVGRMGVGKTSLINRFVKNEFDTKYKSTIGVDFLLKKFEVEKGKEVSLQFWDIAGFERYGSMARVYYKDALAAFVVFDATNHQTLEDARLWKQDIDSRLQPKIPVILLANKIDSLTEDQISERADQEVSKFAVEYEFIEWAKTSAKTGVGIIESITRLVKVVIEKGLVQPQEKVGITLTEPAPKLAESRCFTGCT